jgi:hypothetical protein
MAGPPQLSLNMSGMQASLAFQYSMTSGMKVKSMPYGNERPKRNCYTCFDMDLRTGMPDNDGLLVHFLEFLPMMQNNQLGETFCLSCGFLSTCMMTTMMTFENEWLNERSTKLGTLMLESRVANGPLYVAWCLGHFMYAPWSEIAIRMELYTLPGTLNNHLA